MCADFKYYLNRSGPRGPQGYKGDKGDDGKTPVPRTGTNTPIETTVIFDTGDGNPYETPNLKYPIEDRGGNMVMLDRTNETQYYGTPNKATDDSYGVVKLATPESILDDPLDSDVVTYKLFDNNNQDIKTITDGLAGDITQLNTDLGTEVINRANADTQLINKINTDVGNEATARSNADTALSGRIDDLTTSKANKSDVYTKTQTDSLLNNKSNVGHTHNYNEITNKPDIGNGTITFKQGNTTIGTITTNQLSNSTLTFADPTGITPGSGLDLDSSTNILSVKVDNDTLGINSDGEIEVQNAGTTYSEGNAIDLTNDAISVKYDNSTLKLNGSGQLYADIPAANDATITITQGGVTKGTFTTNQSTDATIALDAGPDMSGYYTKTQTDSLLDKKIDNDIVQTPLEYLPDTTSSLNTQNVDTSTMSFSNGAGCFYSMTVGFENPPIYLKDSNNNIIAWNNTTLDLINNISIGYFETSFSNGINFSIKENGDRRTLYCYVLGYYTNNIFNPVASMITVPRYLYQPLYFPNTGHLYTYKEYDNWTNYKYFNIYKAANSTTVNFISDFTNGSAGTSSTTTITQDESDALDLCTHIRIVSLVRYQLPSDTPDMVYLSNIKIVNPSPSSNIVTSGNYSSRNDIFENGTNIFDAHPASLSLKYDSNTLGVNSNNELTVPTATTSNLGLVKPDGTTITINNGVISAAGGSSYTLPTATTSTLGGVKIDGTTITIDGNGVISAAGGGGGSSVTADTYTTILTGNSNEYISLNSEPGIGTKSLVSGYTTTSGATIDSSAFTLSVTNNSNSGLYRDLPNETNGSISKVHIKARANFTSWNTSTRENTYTLHNTFVNGNRLYYEALDGLPMAIFFVYGGTANGYGRLGFEYSITGGDSDYIHGVQYFGDKLIALNETHTFEVYHDRINRTLTFIVDGQIDKIISDIRGPGDDVTSTSYGSTGYYNGVYGASYYSAQEQIAGTYAGTSYLDQFILDLDFVNGTSQTVRVVSPTENYSNVPIANSTNYGMIKIDPERISYNNKGQITISDKILNSSKVDKTSSGFNIIGEVSQYGGM